MVSALACGHLDVEGPEVRLIGIGNETLEVSGSVLVLILEYGLGHEGIETAEHDDHDAKYDQVEESKLEND